MSSSTLHAELVAEGVLTGDVVLVDFTTSSTTYPVYRVVEQDARMEALDQGDPHLSLDDLSRRELATTP